MKIHPWRPREVRCADAAALTEEQLAAIRFGAATKRVRDAVRGVP